MSKEENAPICNCYDDGVGPVLGSNCNASCGGTTGYPNGRFPISKAPANESWIIVRDGPFRYFKTGDGLENWSRHQRDAMRFPTRQAAQRGIWKWENCYMSSWPPRIARLVPKKEVVVPVRPEIDEEAISKVIASQSPEDLANFLEVAVFVADHTSDKKKRGCRCAACKYLVALGDAFLKQAAPKIVQPAEE